jgi:regulator of replication initiation timing
MRRPLIAVLTAAGLGLGGLGLAGGALVSAAEDPARFSMTPADKGFLRLDKQTGAVSVCSDKSGKWACEAVSDDHAQLQGEIARLTKENEDLKAENKRLEEALGLGDDKNKQAEGGPKAGRGLKLPTEQEIDKAMDEIGRLVRKFKDKIKDIVGEERGERL